jgi:ubiquinone/menaquinone biosynthesis C-methylase UbiE
VNAAALLNKHRIADSFSRAAQTYDAAAELQRQIGHQLLESLPDTRPDRVLDLGSGTGYFTPLLRQRFASSQLVSLDLAQGMLAYARQHRPDSHAAWVCGDAEALPLASDSLDLIFSSLAIQWCERPDRLFAEIARVLRPGGRFVVATLQIWGRYTVHYTPTHGSWLNQAEIEIGVYARQCLGKRRIPDLKTLRDQTTAWNRRVNQARQKIAWKIQSQKGADRL